MRANDRRPFTRSSGCAFGGTGSGWRPHAEDRGNSDRRHRSCHIRAGRHQGRPHHRCCHPAFHAVLRRGARARRAHRIGADGLGGHRPHRHDSRTPSDGPGRAPRLCVRHAGVPDHPHHHRDPGPAVARYRRRHSLPVAIPHLLHRPRHDRLRPDRAARGDQHPAQEVHRPRPGLAMARHSLRLLRGLRIRGPARAARRTCGQALRRLELRVRDRGNRPRSRRQVPGHLAAAEGNPWLIPQRRPGQALGFLAVARRGHEPGADPARRDGSGPACWHGLVGRRRRPRHGSLGRASGTGLVPIFRPAAGPGSRAGLRRAIVLLRRLPRPLRRLPRPRVHAARCPALGQRRSERAAGPSLPGGGPVTVSSGRSAARGSHADRSRADGPVPVGSVPVGSARPARQPLYEPGYDGPPRFEGAPRGHGDVPADELSSYPYGPQGHRPPPALPYADPYADLAGSDGRPGSDGRTGSRPGWPESAPPRPAIPAPPRREDRNSGPMPTLGTGSMPQLGTGPMPGHGPVVPRPDGAATPRPDTGPMPRVGPGQVPRHGSGPMPRAGTGPMPRADSGPMPRADSGPMPRVDSGPMPRVGTGPMPRPDGAATPRPDTGPMPRVGPGQVPRHGSGPMPRAGTGPMPRANSGPMPRMGTGPMPRPDTGPMPRPDSRGLPRSDTGPMPRVETGPLPRPGAGPMSGPDTGSLPRPGSGPPPRPGQPAGSADPAAGPRTGPLPAAEPRSSHRAKPNDPRYRDIPRPTGGEEWE